MVASAAKNSVLRALGINKLAEGQISRAVAKTQGRVTELAAPASFPHSRLFVPTDGATHPGVLLLHGAEGAEAGFVNTTAVRLAEEGMAAMTFGYYGAPGLKQQIVEIPLENTLAAARWLKSSPHVGGRDLGIYGVSRGAEQTLLLASLDEEGLIKAVAAQAPNAAVTPSLEPSTFKPVLDATGQERAAWTYRGEDVRPGPQQIDRFDGPVLLAHGMEDKHWPVENTYELMQKLRAAGNPPTVKLFPGQGHALTRHARTRAEDLFAEFFHRNLT